jgi:hypothetical protein
MTQATTAQIEQTIKDAFGLWPEDVIAPARMASDVFHQLAELFKTIKDEAEKNGPVSHRRIKHLAGAGAYLAFDFGELASGQFSDMAAHLNAAGIQIGESK